MIRGVKKREQEVTGVLRGIEGDKESLKKVHSQVVVCLGSVLNYLGHFGYVKCEIYQSSFS